jgi:hypothetical protein
VPEIHRSVRVVDAPAGGATGPGFAAFLSTTLENWSVATLEK